MVGRLLLSTAPMCLSCGLHPCAKAAPVPYVGTSEPFSLDFMTLCLCT